MSALEGTVRLNLSASVIVLAVSVGAVGIAFAVEQPSSAALQRSRAELAHEKTIVAATRANDTAAAAADALCRQDRATQTRTRAAAEAAQKQVDAAAQAEAEETPDVAQAHYVAIGGRLAMNGVHSPEELEKLKSETDAKLDAYSKLKDATAKSIADAALQSVAGPAKASGCPAPAAPPQRAAQPNPIPPLPATPVKATAMLRSFSNPVFKAALAQPGLRGRVETLLGLEGCDWSVNETVARQATPRNAATFLNRMNDEDLRETLSNGIMLDRIYAAVGRGSCNVAGPENNPVTQFPTTNNNRNQDPGPYPYGYPDDARRNPNRIIPPVSPYGAPYGAPYGGYAPGYIP